MSPDGSKPAPWLRGIPARLAVVVILAALALAAGLTTEKPEPPSFEERMPRVARPEDRPPTLAERARLAALRTAAPAEFSRWRAAQRSQNREAEGPAFQRLTRAAPLEMGEFLASTYERRGDSAADLLRIAPLRFLRVIASPEGSAEKDRAMLRLALANPEAHAAAFPSSPAEDLATAAALAPAEFARWREAVEATLGRGSPAVDLAADALRLAVPPELGEGLRFWTRLTGPRE